MACGERPGVNTSRPYIPPGCWPAQLDDVLAAGLTGERSVMVGKLFAAIPGEGFVELTRQPLRLFDQR